MDDPSIFPDVDIHDVDFDPIKMLVRKFEKAKIPLIIKDISSDIGIPTFNARQHRMANSRLWIPC